MYICIYIIHLYLDVCFLVIMDVKLDAVSADNIAVVMLPLPSVGEWGGRGEGGTGSEFRCKFGGGGRWGRGVWNIFELFFFCCCLF